MERQEIFEKVKVIVEAYTADLSRIKEIQGNTRIKEDLACDSLDGVEISMDIDKTFGINTTEDKDIEIINNGTVDDIVDMVEKKINSKE